MKKKILFLFSVLTLTSNFIIIAQEDSDTAKKENVLPEFKNLSELHVGYYGTTLNCEPFSIYAFKYKRTWMFIAKKETNSTFVVVKPPRTSDKGVVPGSNFLYKALSLAKEDSYLKLRKRRKVVKDIEVYGFYKFYHPGKKAMKGVLLLDYPDPNIGLPWPFRWLSGKAEEVGKSVEGVLPEVKTDIPLPEVSVETPEIAIPEITVPEINVPGVTISE